MKTEDVELAIELQEKLIELINSISDTPVEHAGSVVEIELWTIYKGREFMVTIQPTGREAGEPWSPFRAFEEESSAAASATASNG